MYEIGIMPMESGLLDVTRAMTLFVDPCSEESEQLVPNPNSNHGLQRKHDQVLRAGRILNEIKDSSTGFDEDLQHDVKVCSNMNEALQEIINHVGETYIYTYTYSTHSSSGRCAVV